MRKKSVKECAEKMECLGDGCSLISHFVTMSGVGVTASGCGVPPCCGTLAHQ